MQTNSAQSSLQKTAKRHAMRTSKASTVSNTIRSVGATLSFTDQLISVWLFNGHVCHSSQTISVTRHNKLTPRPTAGCCHLANLMAWSLALYVESFMKVPITQLTNKHGLQTSNIVTKNNTSLPVTVEVIIIIIHRRPDKTQCFSS